tara:strand:- start:1873 stop:2505 length:633 start_codon:yes stop_codon:yes gene_type:complete
MKVKSLIKKKYKTLYLFITHEIDYSKTLNKCIENYSDYLIVIGGHKSNYLQENTLYLNANDSYDGLPEKVYKAMKYVVTDEALKDYTHICKLDSDMIIKKVFDQQILSKNEYFGIVQREEGNRSWGKEKFTENSKFKYQDYEGIFVPWCLGGYGYVVSFNAIKQIVEDNINFNDEPYEDLLIAKLLNRKKIYPNNFKNLSKYVDSPFHKY